MARKAFYTNESFAKRGDSGRVTYSVVVVVENETGYYPWSDWFATVPVAQAEADRLNAAHGLTQQDVNDIVLSSFRGR